MRTDKELLDALDAENCGIGLIHDDVAHWFVVTDGMQSIPENSPEPFQTGYFVDDECVERAGGTVREAINRYLDWVNQDG